MTDLKLHLESAPPATTLYAGKQWIWKGGMIEINNIISLHLCFFVYFPFYSSLARSLSAILKINIYSSSSGLPSWQDPRQTDQHVHRPNGPTPRRDSTLCLTPGAQLTNNSLYKKRTVSSDFHVNINILKPQSVLQRIDSWSANFMPDHQ